jgi:hypothetical protein
MGEVGVNLFWQLGLGSDMVTADEYWIFQVHPYVDLFSLRPYAQTIWWTNFINSAIQNNGAVSGDAYVGGSYSLQFG